MLARADQVRLTVLGEAIGQVRDLPGTLSASPIATIPRRLIRALWSLKIFTRDFNPATTHGRQNIDHMKTAQVRLVANLGHALPPFAMDESVACDNPRLIADAGLFDGRDPRKPILVCPVFFGMRAECQAFILMHEVFHLVGILGHGTGYEPESALGNPSSLATFAWVLATGTDPRCSESSPSLEPVPTDPRGPVA